MRDGIKITIHDVPRAVSLSKEILSNTSLAVNLVSIFRESTISSFMAILLELAKEGKTHAPGSDLR